MRAEHHDRWAAVLKVLVEVVDTACVAAVVLALALRAFLVRIHLGVP